MDHKGQPNNPDQAPEPSKKFMLEENIKTSKLWGEAVKRGQYAGTEARAIAGLINFLEDQHDKSLAEYEAESLRHPDWGRPKELVGMLSDRAAAGRPS